MREHLRSQTLRLLLLICAVIVPLSSAAGPDAPADFSHADWHAVLQRFVDDHGLVDYRALAEERTQLDAYLTAVAEISPQSHPQLFPTREDQLAYFLNAYNALVFQGVLDLAPDIETVWGKSGTGYGFFVKTKVVLGDRRTNLRKLENQDIRRQFEDPRIHAALNCASLGCPRLPREIFDPRRLDDQLDQAMAEFVGDQRHCAFDEATGTVALSKIFDWFRSDFDSAGGLIAYLNRYREADEQIPEDTKIRFLPYDKRLNRQ